MSSIAVFGLMIGSLFSKPFLKFGLRRLILASNALIFIVTFPIFFVDVTAFYFLCFTRLFIGVLAAVIINATVAYIGDAVPKEAALPLYMTLAQPTCQSDGMPFCL